MMGHHVTCANDAARALELIDASRRSHVTDEGLDAPQPFDLVISDIHMPGTMNGIDLAEAVQTMKPKMPVILVTGYAEELERARHVDVRVLSKPFDIGLLERMLEEITRDQTPGPRGNVERDATL
jgi:CheY-like chemotaxis protein